MMGIPFVIDVFNVGRPLVWLQNQFKQERKKWGTL